MLLLKYLEYDETLANLALGKWMNTSLEEHRTFYNFRASSNAVYPFYLKEKEYCGKLYSSEKCYLRISPVKEKRKENIYGELDFIQYLNQCGYPSLRPIESNNKHMIETIDYMGETYYASVFREVAGKAIEDIQITEQVIYQYGKALGRLHMFSSKYKPGLYSKWTYQDALDWMQKVLLSLGDQDLALRECLDVSEKLSRLEKTEKNFGLVHYDFEIDNVFYDEKSQSCYVIDFEDGMVHWYGLDIEQAIDSLCEVLDRENMQEAKQIFLDGYASEWDISYALLECLPLFRRFVDLYSYVRLSRVMNEKYEDEPEWMRNLRKKLQEKIARIKESYSVWDQ